MKRVFTLIPLFLLFISAGFSQSSLMSVTCLTGDNDETVVGYRRVEKNDKVFLVRSASSTGNYINEPIDSTDAQVNRNIWLAYVSADNNLRWSKNLRPILNFQTIPVNVNNYQFVADQSGIALVGAVQEPDSIHGSRDKIWFVKFSNTGDTLVPPVHIDTYYQYQYNGDYRKLESIIGDKVSDNTYLFALVYRNYSEGNYLVMTNSVNENGVLLGQKEYYYENPVDLFFCKGHLFNSWHDPFNSKYLSKFDDLGTITQTELLEENTGYTSYTYGRQLTSDDKVLYWGYQQHTYYIDSIRRKLLFVDPETMSLTTRSSSFDTTGFEYFYFTYGGTAGNKFNTRPQDNHSDYITDFYYTISHSQDTLVHYSLIRFDTDQMVAWDKELNGLIIDGKRYVYYDYNSMVTADRDGYVIVSQRLTDELYSNDSKSALSKLNAANGDILWSTYFPDAIVVNSRSYRITRNDRLRFTNVQNGIQYYLVTYYQEITPNFNMVAIYKLDVITGELSIDGTYFVSGNFAVHADDFYIDESGQPWIAGYSVSPVFCAEDNFNNVVVLKLRANYNTVKGKIYIDYNNNNIQDNGEPYYTNGFITHTKGDVTRNNFIYYNNQYQVAIDTGKYIFKFTPVSTLFTVSPVSRTVNHTDYNNTDVANFALKPVGVVYDADVVLINTFMTRLGRGNGYVVSCSNKGNQPLNNAQLKLKLDDRLSVQTASEAYALNGDTLIWNISNLQPGERVSITVDFMAAVPPELNPGETVVSCAWVYVPGGDVNLLDNTWCLLDEIRAAYDPNDKTASAEDIDLSAIARREPLAYTIRFENLGNDTAFTVVIKDTLPDNVDFSSLQPVASSHPYTLEVVNGKYLTFTFNNILLPDKSTDSVHSHGFVAYQVVPLSGFSPGNYEIKNTAHIYFDYNLPVTTNTATTRVQIITAIQNNPALAQYIHLYPNPTQDQLVVDIQKLNGEKVQLKLFDLSGKLVQAQFTSQSLTTIDVSRLPAGEYVLQVQTTAGMVAGKVIIAH